MRTPQVPAMQGMAPLGVRSKPVTTDYRMTPVGPIAKIGGKWYSINGTRNDIVDIRYEATKNTREFWYIPSEAGAA